MKEKEKEEIREEEKKKSKKALILVLLLLVFISIFSLSLTYGKGIYQGIGNQIIKTFNLSKPTSPVITGGSDEWSKERLIRVEKDAYSRKNIAYYEYCVRAEKSSKKCEWKKTETKNTVVSESGIYYVTFRGVTEGGERGNESNIEKVYIDNNSPIIKNIKEKEITTDSIGIEVEAEDELSGIQSYLYSIDGIHFEEGKLNYTYRGLEAGKEYIIYIKVVDKVGNSTVLSMKESTKLKDNQCGLNCDTDGDGKCDLNCDTDGDGKCDLNCDTDGDGKCDLNCDTDGDGKCDLNCNIPNPSPTTTPIPTEKPNPSVTPSPTITPSPTENPKPEEEKEIPVINLDKVPVKFVYGDKYSLPSYYSFGKDTGEVQCVVRGKEYKDTTTLEIGKHLIVCEAVSSHNIRVMVEKEVEVLVEEGEEEVWDGWIRLNLYYPENSTNWEWRIGKEGEIRDGYENTEWQAYTGPILVKLSDVDDVYIRYDLNGEVYVVSPSGKVAVDIEPIKYTLRKEEETEVTIYYDKDSKTKEYRIDGGEWEEYKGSFKVGPNTVIEARATKEEKVYDSEGNYLYTSKRTGADSVFISEYIEEGTPGGGSGTTGGGVGYEPGTNPGGETITKPTPESKPSTYLEGPIISSNPSVEIVESVKVMVTPKEVAEKVYFSIGYGKFEEYTKEISVTNNTIIRAYYIRSSDGKVSETSYYYVQNIKEKSLPYVRIDATPNNYLTGTQETVNVAISGRDYEKLEYSLDGVIYYPYTESLTVRESSTIYAKGTNANGEKIETLTIVTKTPSKKKEKLNIHITLNPSKEEIKGLVNKSQVEINYDSKAEKKYYKIGNNGEWKEYQGVFEVTSNTTVYAYCTSNNGEGSSSKAISYLTTGISNPIITGRPTSAAQQVKIEISYDEKAEVKRYKVGNGPELEYNGAFYVYENTTITAYNKNVLGYEGSSKYEVGNIIEVPRYTVLDEGDYYLIKLNYPSTSDPEKREYKWKENGEWKKYDSHGILLIKPEYKDKVIVEDGVKIKDSNGKEIVIKDHYYIIDVPLDELMENLFMRWDTTKVKAPEILVNPTGQPTREVEVGILYSSSLEKKYYKIVTEEGNDSGWMEYKGSFKVKENNVVIYAKGETITGIESEVEAKKVTNIDKEAPKINISGEFIVPKRQVTVSVNATDNMMMYMVKWARGDQTKEYFKEKGNSIRNPGTFKVEENGKYTIYAVDQVGNESIEVIEITNIDLTAPNIIIQVLTEKYGPEAEVSIQYGDSKVKEYRLGETTAYQSYTGNIIIKSLDVMNLANEDGSLTIYARGEDEAGNIREVSEKIYVLDLDIPKAPDIHSTAGYPLLTEYGVKLGQDNYINYDTRDDITNYYSLDNGKTWEIYTGPFEIKTGTIMAKSVKNISGLTVISTKEVSMPVDALGPNAYDGDEKTADTLQYGNNKKIYISPTMYGKKVQLYIYIAYFQSTGFSFCDSEGNKLSDYLLSNENSVSTSKYIRGEYVIPDNASYIVFYDSLGHRSSSSVYEVTPYSSSVLEETKYYPMLTEHGVNPAYNEVVIDYFPTSVQRLYRINEGEWKEYQDKAIQLGLNDRIETKGIDRFGKETIVSSHVAVLVTDALGPNAYDGDEKTADTLQYGNNKKIYISPTMYGKKVQLYIYIAYFQSTGFSFCDSKGNKLSDYLLSNENSVSTSKYIRGEYLIPDNASYIVFYDSLGHRSSSSVYEVTPYSSPVLEETKYYPALTMYGVMPGYSEITINYFPTSVQRLYRINEGEWKEYQDKAIRLEPDDRIETKGIDRFGKETIVSSHVAVLVADALKPETYDGDGSTGQNISAIPGKLYVDESMNNKKYIMNGTEGYGEQSKFATIIYYDDANKEIKTEIIRAYTPTLIPSGTKYMQINGTWWGSQAAVLHEVCPYSSPILEETKYYPTLTEHGVNPAYNEVIIDYFPTSVQRLYRINEGDWKEYQDRVIRLELNDKIEAKGIDRFDKETTVSSYISVSPADALGPETYDGDGSTKQNISAIPGKLYVDESMNNKKYIMNGTEGYGEQSKFATIIYYDDANKEIKTEIIRAYTPTLIPSGTKYMQINGTWWGSQAAFLHEVLPSNIPSIFENVNYPTLSINGFSNSKCEVVINYLSHLDQKLYSLDNGTTWKEYTKPIELEKGSKVLAKAIDKEGVETEVSSYTVIGLSDDLPVSAFDNNKETVASIPNNVSKVFQFDPSVFGKTVRIYTNGIPAVDSIITLYNANDEELLKVPFTSLVTVFVIPNGSVKGVITSGSTTLNIKEINIREDKQIENNMPLIEIDDSNWTDRKVVEITYPEGYESEYSLDLGETWQKYLGPITIEKEAVVFARALEEEKVISSSSLSITKIDNIEPSIEINIPDIIVLAEEYNLPTSYTVGKSGGNAICKIGEEEVTNTEALVLGVHEISCTVRNNVGIEKSIKKAVKVVDSLEYEGDSILGILSREDLRDGVSKFTVNGITYPVHLYVINGNQNWKEDQVFGDAKDVATATTNAQNMVIVKVNGDVTIGSGVTVRPYYNTYGGPKGFTMYVTGTLTNNGTIDNSHGAKAVGENVYLWKNADGTYEYVPASGGRGGNAVTSSSYPVLAKNGLSGAGGSTVGARATGGGGSGTSKGGITSGAGSAGTSYSGGTGGGAKNSNGGTATSGSINGGAGGNAFSNVDAESASAGSGNPGGVCTGTRCSNPGRNGTGGLLNIYGNSFINNGMISANGTSAISATVAGGSSGGGSINIFYTNVLTRGSISVNGGSSNNGGAGGSGSITIGKISEENFIKQ